ncbi:MAG: sigma-E processing peptidase SpoIIGA [Alistipes sp.]|nr:sigma-E processing peptidase SpoIIGA [Alistipes sp.]
MQTIYVDVLIVLNIYVNYFLLRMTAAITHSRLKAVRCFLAALYGSFFSLLILAPELNSAVTLLIKLAAAVTVVMAAFGIHGYIRLIKNTAAFFTVNFAAAGAVYAVYIWFKPDFMRFGNSYFYIDFSLLILILVTAGLYFLLCLFRRFFRSSECDSYRVMIRRGRNTVVVDGLADTGNRLRDYFSGKPVIICGRDDLLPLELGEISTERLPKGFRLLPCTTVSAEGLIPVFHADELLIINSVTGERKSVDAMIGIGEHSGRAVFDPKIIG